MSRIVFKVFPLSDSKCQIVASKEYQIVEPWDFTFTKDVEYTIVDMIFISVEINHFLKHRSFSSREPDGSRQR